MGSASERKRRKSVDSHKLLYLKPAVHFIYYTQPGRLLSVTAPAKLYGKQFK